MSDVICAYRSQLQRLNIRVFREPLAPQGFLGDKGCDAICVTPEFRRDGRRAIKLNAISLIFSLPSKLGRSFAITEIFKDITNKVAWNSMEKIEIRQVTFSSDEDEDIRTKWFIRRRAD